MRTPPLLNRARMVLTRLIDRPSQLGPNAPCGPLPARTGAKRPTAGCGIPHDDEPWDPDAGRDIAALEDRLTAVLQPPDRAVLPEVDIADFAYWIHKMQRGQQCGQRQDDAPDQLGRMDIVRWIAEAQTNGNLNEALWRGFLAGHFGRGSADPSKSIQIESAGQLLCGFGVTPKWTWDTVSSGLPVFELWLHEHTTQLREELQFTNHRKYESKKPGDVFRVVESFVEWVDLYGGTPSLAFATAEGRTPEEGFDDLYHRVGKLHRFGRLAALDLLIFPGEVHLLPVRPGSVYLKGASGPLEGARKLWGDLPVDELAWRADELARRVPLPFDIVEDALCMWQK